MANNQTLSFNDLPEKAFEELTAGTYILKIEDIIKEEDPEFGTKFTMTHEIVGTGRKVMYDNYKLFDKNGAPEVFGQSKLRKLLEATNLTNLEEISITVLKVVAVGKLFKANLEVSDKGFANIKYSQIFPLEDSAVALNADAEVKESPKQKEKADTPSKEVVQEINDEDI